MYVRTDMYLFQYLIWYRIFRYCIFHPCYFGPAFSSPVLPSFVLFWSFFFRSRIFSQPNRYSQIAVQLFIYFLLR